VESLIINLKVSYNKNYKFMITYLTTYFQPILGLIIGLVLFALLGYVHWYGTNKEDTINWIAKNIFLDNMNSGISATSLFNVITSILFAISWILIGLAIWFLNS
jgi:hypothetical protein